MVTAGFASKPPVPLGPGAPPAVTLLRKADSLRRKLPASPWCRTIRRARRLD